MRVLPLKYALVQATAIALLTSCFLTLHSEKTKIVYCKDDRRQGIYPIVQFDFLGYTFRPRRVRSTKTGTFVGFNPGISGKSAVAIRREMRSWQLRLHSDLTLEQLARRVNPFLRGWINYYGVYFRSALIPVVNHLDHILSRWVVRKYKRFKRKRWSALQWVQRMSWRQPKLFAHWTALRTSRMIGGV